MLPFQYNTIKFYDLFQFQKEKPAFGLHKVRVDIFDRFFGSLPFRSGSRRGGRKVWGEEFPRLPASLPRSARKILGNGSFK